MKKDLDVFYYFLFEQFQLIVKVILYNQEMNDELNIVLVVDQLILYLMVEKLYEKIVQQSVDQLRLMMRLFLLLMCKAKIREDVLGIFI
jgi:hypothetical protein